MLGVFSIFSRIGASIAGLFAFLSPHFAGKTLYLAGKQTLLAGKTLYPAGKQILLAGKTLYPAGKQILLAGKTLYPAGKQTLLASKMLYLAGKGELVAGRLLLKVVGTAQRDNSAIISPQVLNTEQFIQGAFVDNQNLVQRLEPRRLLAASFASLSSHDTLSIIGTTKNDTITISLTNGKIVAKLNSASMSFAKSSVKRIWADGVHGNDNIVNDTALPSTLLGSTGDDTLRGGSGDDSLDGGDGADLVQPRDGTNVGPLQPAQDVLDYAGATAGDFYVQYDGASAYVTHGANRQDMFQCSVESQFDTLKFFATGRNDDVSGIAEHAFPIDVHRCRRK